MRRVAGADHDQLLALCRVAFSEIEGARGASTRRENLGGSTESFVEQVYSEEGPLTLVALIDEELCGFTTISTQLHQLNALFVAPRYRRSGAGRALVEAAQREVDALGEPPLRAIISAGSRGEKSLFEALGYRAELLVMERRAER